MPIPVSVIAMVFDSCPQLACLADVEPELGWLSPGPQDMEVDPCAVLVRWIIIQHPQAKFISFCVS